MRNGLTLLLLGVLMGFTSLITGCASANLQVTKEMPLPPPRVVVVKIGAALGVEMPSDVLDSFRTMVTTSLSQKGFQLASGNPTSNAVALSGTVTAYDPGSRFGRWLLPGVGGGKFDSTWTVSDANGVELSKAQIDGSVYAGAFGGDFDNVLKEAAERVSDLLTKKKQ